MRRGIWLLFFFALVLASAAVVTVVLLANRPIPYQAPPAQTAINPDLDGSANPADFTDAQIVELQRQLQNDDSIVRLAAIGRLSSLASADHARFAPLLIKELGNTNDTVRYVAAKGLTDMRYIPAARALTDLLDDPAQEVRVQAGEGLITLGDDGLAAVMEALAEDRIKSIDTALTVVTSITEIGFGRGKQGREAALRYWAEQNHPTSDR